MDALVYPNSLLNNDNDAYMALVGCYRFNDGWTNDDFATPLGLLYLDLAGGHGTEKENFTTLMASTNTLATSSNINSYLAECLFYDCQV